MTLPKPYYQDNHGVLYHGDCLEIMKDIPDKSIDLVLTDPPYGIGENYDKFQDTEENTKELINKFLPEARRIGKLVVLTCGQKRIFDYPKPDWILSWVVPEGSGCSAWGFICWHAILVYGKDPYLTNNLGSMPDIIMGQRGEVNREHPCSKPLVVWSKLLNRTSVKKTDTILDPFAGSGTTLRAAKDLGRKYIGIEISEKYCEIIARRMGQEVLF